MDNVAVHVDQPYVIRNLVRRPNRGRRMITNVGMIRDQNITAICSVRVIDSRTGWVDGRIGECSGANTTKDENGRVLHRNGPHIWPRDRTAGGSLFDHNTVAQATIPCAGSGHCMGFIRDDYPLLRSQSGCRCTRTGREFDSRRPVRIPRPAGWSHVRTRLDSA